ncbi:MAG: exodeoxyribonuclease VII small subunit [Candidatus Latescibacteria bacterium]|nr:exodeoxyribonuclease VII small subunit [Candidatus Latescibacterota bacterium]
MSESSFEESLRRLEEVIGDLENSDLPLGEAISRFEEGMRIVKVCEEFLTSARLRVEQLIAEVGGGYRVEEWKTEG